LINKAAVLFVRKRPQMILIWTAIGKAWLGVPPEALLEPYPIIRPRIICVPYFILLQMKTFFCPLPLCKGEAFPFSSASPRTWRRQISVPPVGVRLIPTAHPFHYAFASRGITLALCILL
jgi:hypothetical protein